MLVVRVVVVHVDGLVAAFARGPERFFAPAPQLDHRNGYLRVLRQVALIGSHFEEHVAPVLEAVELLDHGFLVARKGDRRDQLRRFGELFVRIVELHLHGVDAAAQIAAQLLQVGILRQLVGHDGPADAHGDRLALLVEQFVGQVERAEDRVDASHKMEPFRVLRLEVDRNHRHVGVADELDDRRRPGNVFHGALLERSPVFGTLVRGHFARREQAETAAGGQVLLGHTDAGQAAARRNLVVERIDGEE